MHGHLACVQDRVPYITTLRNGTPSIVPKTRNVHHNFFIGTYNSQEAMDTDDGSAYLHTHANVMVYGDNGLKSDFGGHDHVWESNLLLYVGNCCASLLRASIPARPRKKRLVAHLAPARMLPLSTAAYT